MSAREQWTLFEAWAWPTHRTYTARAEGSIRRYKVRVLRGPFFRQRAWRKLDRAARKHGF